MLICTSAPCPSPPQSVLCEIVPVGIYWSEKMLRNVKAIKYCAMIPTAERSLSLFAKREAKSWETNSYHSSDLCILFIQ